MCSRWPPFPKLLDRCLLVTGLPLRRIGDVSRTYPRPERNHSETPIDSLVRLVSCSDESASCIWRWAKTSSSWLEEAYDQRDGSLVWCNVSPEWELLRSDVRFQNLPHRMGFPGK